MTNLCGLDIAVADCSKGEELIYLFLIIGSIVAPFFLLSRCVRTENSTDNTNRSPSPSAPPIEDEESVNRHTLVLTSIIHKKVITSTTDQEEDEDLMIKFQNENKVCKSSKKAFPSLLKLDKVDEESLQRIISERSIRLRSKSQRRKSDVNEEDKNLFDIIKKDMKDDIMIETLRSIRSTQSGDGNRYDDDIEGDTLYNPRMCPICCEEYEKGDDIAWSKNEDCVHAFHTDCIVPWLLEHSDCPMCRNDYLCLEEVVL